jgi:hypothetical protein
VKLNLSLLVEKAGIRFLGMKIDPVVLLSGRPASPSLFGSFPAPPSAGLFFSLHTPRYFVQYRHKERCRRFRIVFAQALLK